jgi:hypothetical protein
MAFVLMGTRCVDICSSVVAGGAPGEGGMRGAPWYVLPLFCCACETNNGQATDLQARGRRTPALFPNSMYLILNFASGTL